MPLFDKLRVDPRGSVLLQEIGRSYRYVSDTSERVTFSQREGGGRVFVCNLSDLERLALDLRAGRSPSTPPAGGGHRHPPDQPDERVAELRAENRQLRERERRAIEERDAWQRRAELVEAELAKLRAPTGLGDGVATERYKALKSLIARELHPDAAKGSAIEAVLRAELFKRIWPMVQRLDTER